MYLRVGGRIDGWRGEEIWRFELGGWLIYLFLLMPHCGNFGRGVIPDLVGVEAERMGRMFDTPEWLHKNGL